MRLCFLGVMITNKYRLASITFEREKDEEKIDPQKIYFLAVEGNVTEKEYFDGLSKFRAKLGIDARVDVEVLKRERRDTNSAPKDVIELLEEYVQLRGKQSNLFQDIPGDFIKEYGIDFIEQYLNSPEALPKKERNKFVTSLRNIGYDINYRKYLSKYDNEMDEFCILIDRDIQTHSEVNIQDSVSYCSRKGYRCFIANPCFEFWLLLHLSDVKNEYAESMDLIKNNPKISDAHTFVSKQVSDKAHHGKGGIGFEIHYLPYVESAIERAKGFASDEVDLINNIGCNLWKLVEEMIKY